MTVWFTADTHFGHHNIIKYANRPYGTIEGHDEVLIANWNDMVRGGDLVYHLGDFGFGKKPEMIERLARRLNGCIHLIYGNHDNKVVRKAEACAKVEKYLEDNK